MYYIEFNKTTVIPAASLKEAYKYFMSDARFFVHKKLEDYHNAIIYKDKEKKYNWTYCKALSSDDINYLDDDPYCFICSPYYFFSRRL